MEESDMLEVLRRYLDNAYYRFLIFLGLRGQARKVSIQGMPATINKSCTSTVTARDGNGRWTAVPTPVSWTMDPPDVLSMIVSADTLTAKFVVIEGKTGIVSVTTTCPDPMDNANQLTDTDTLTVPEAPAGPAQSINLEFSDIV